MNAPLIVLSPAASFGHGVVVAIRGTAVTIIDIAFTIAVIACVLVLAWVLRRRLLKPDDAIRIAIRDLTADAAASEASARALSEQLVAELRRAHDSFRGAEDIDESEDLDGSPSLNLRALHGAAELDSASMQDISIQVGGVSTSLRSLLALWIQFAARPPAVAISGSFASTDPEAILALESSRPRSPQKSPWKGILIHGGDSLSAAARRELASVARDIDITLWSIKAGKCGRSKAEQQFP